MKIEATPINVVPANREIADTKSEPVVIRPDMQVPTGNAGAKTEVRKEDLKNMVEQMNTTMKIFNHALQFRVSETGRVVITVFDANSGEVIRQIPPEALVDAFDHVDKVLGLLMDRKV